MRTRSDAYSPALKRRQRSATWTCPASGCTPLKGDLAGFWSVTVSGNWRVIFRLEGGTPATWELVDYHHVK